jgi:hypothetical protein
LDKYTNQPEPKVAAAVNVCVKVPLVISTKVLVSAVPKIVFDVLAERTIVGLVEIVAHTGAPDPALCRS